MTRLLVVRLGSLGDLVHALPAVAAMRRGHPGAEIDWLVDAAHREFLALVPGLASIVELHGRTARAWLAARRALRARRYDLAVDFQGLVKSAALARLSGAREVAGFDRAALREGAAAIFYTRRVAVGEGRHVIEKNLRLAAAVGGRGDARVFELAAVDSPALAAIGAGARGRLALINPGAAWPNKRWPPDRFGRLARRLADRHGLHPVVLWGPGERALAAAVVDASDGRAAAAPATTIADLVALARAAALIVSGDTGPLHIAAAAGTPAVALFGPTNPRRNGPWAEGDVALGRYDACACHYRRRCRQPGSWCLADISEADVDAAVDARLAGASGGAGAGEAPA